MENNLQDKTNRKSYVLLFGVSLNILALVWLVLLFKTSTGTGFKMLWSALALVPFWYTFYLIHQLMTHTRSKKSLEIHSKELVNKSIANKKLLNKLFVGVLIFLEILILVGLSLLIIFTNWEVTSTSGKTLFDLSSAFQVAALALILIWFGILVAYYAWAIYFYNINLGLTNQDWAEIREQKTHTPDGVSAFPTENPNADQTLGLPPGTVRGTVALTLLVGGLAMAIASLGMDSVLKEDSFVVDNFDFFKTAFLMMIAFYFGNKSLEMIGYKSSKAKKADTGATSASTVNKTTNTSSSTAAFSSNSDSDFDNPLAVQ